MTPVDMQAQRVVFGETLVELADLYPDLLVLDGDLANSTRTDILNKARPDRFLEMASPSRTWLAWRPDWPRWALCRGSALSPLSSPRATSTRFASWWRSPTSTSSLPAATAAC